MFLISCTICSVFSASVMGNSFQARLMLLIRTISSNIRPRVHKAFQNQDQDQAQVKFPLLWTFFETYHNYLTIDCYYLIKYVFKQDFLEF